MLLKLRLFITKYLARLVIGFHWRGQRATDLDVADETMPVDQGRIRVRIYKPHGEGPFPVLHFFHGGGWVFGDLETHDPLCRDLCSRSRHLVIAFDYRLAPKYSFPIPVQDCLASLQWTRDNAVRLGGDPDRIVLCGDSAGGNLAAVTAQQARTLQPGLIKGQVLIYPVTDHCVHAQWPSYKTHGGKGFGLTHASMTELWDIYLRGSPLWPAGTSRHDLATPLHVEDLAGVPRTLVVIAEEDLLRDEAAAYAARLQDAGIEVQVRRYAGQQHGFVGLKPSAAYKQAAADIVAWLQPA
jgi:acetyl esterase